MLMSYSGGRRDSAAATRICLECPVAHACVSSRPIVISTIPRIVDIINSIGDIYLQFALRDACFHYGRLPMVTRSRLSTHSRPAIQEQPQQPQAQVSRFRRSSLVSTKCGCRIILTVGPTDEHKDLERE